MKKWKMIMCMALAGTLLAGGSFSSWAKLSDYDAETAARLQDDKLEYDELENLIREYNPEISYAYNQLDFSDDDTASTVRNLKDSIEKNDYKDTVKALKEQKKQLEAMPDFEGKDAALQELKTTIKGLESMLDAPSATTKATDKQLEKARKQIDTGARSALKGTQTLMITYDNLRAQVQTLERWKSFRRKRWKPRSFRQG